MARSRNIKPGFFTNDMLAELPALTRLFFIGLWTLVDRDGRIEDRPKKLKAECMPYDDIDADAALAALEKSGFILRYVSGSTRCIQVVNWAKHQNPHIKEQPSSLQAPDKSGASPVQTPDAPLPLPEVARLIPSSLIPDSSTLIPKTERGQDGGELLHQQAADFLPALFEKQGFKPTDAAMVCRAMKAVGIKDTNPGDPLLAAMLSQGVTEDEFVGAATSAAKKSKGFAWALTALAGKRADAQALKLAPPADSDETPWHETQGGVDAMASRLGLPKWDGCTPWRGFRKTIVEAAEAARIAA